MPSGGNLGNDSANRRISHLCVLEWYYDVISHGFMLETCECVLWSRYEHKIKGYNSRLDTVQAVILSAKLKRLDEWNDMRAKMADFYREELKGVKGIVTPPTKSDRTHVYQTYAIRIANRDKVCDALKDKKIGVLIHYPIPLHLQEAYKELNHKKGDFPISEQVSSEILSLPMFPHITKEQIHYVCDALKALV